jgi:hypothetical protein
MCPLKSKKGGTPVFVFGEKKLVSYLSIVIFQRFCNINNIGR